MTFRQLPTALLLLLVLAGCGGDDARPAAEDVAPSFYDPPDPLPAGEHGDLLRHERLDVDLPGATAYRMLYLSESVAGRPVAVSGAAVVPDGPGGDRPVLSWAHGTVGLADTCAPSKHIEGLLTTFAAPFIERGWVVAATDYEGLGTPGRHPYLVGESEGRGALDAIRAASQLPRARAGGDAVLWGHSQGGHATLFAAELAPEWTPELELVGAVAGAPPSRLAHLVGELRGGPFQGYIAMAAAGINAARPAARLEQVLSDRAIELLEVVDSGCTDAVFGAFSTLDADEMLVADPTAVPSWRAALDASEPGRRATSTPLLLLHGEADEQIPPASSALLFDRLCGLGQVAERRTYPELGHADLVGAAFGEILAWLDARLEGEPAVNGCPGG